VELWSWPQPKLLGRLEGHEDVVYDVAWLERGKRLATASADRSVRLWEVGTGRCLSTLSGHSGPVLALAVSPDGTLLCSGSQDQTIRVWETGSGRLLRALNNHLDAVHSLAFRPSRGEGQPAYLASVGADATLRLWQPSLGRMVRLVRYPAPVVAVVWSQDGTHMYTGARDGLVRVVEGDSDKVLREYPLASSWVTSLVVRPPDGILVGSSQGAIEHFVDRR
jgi:WD40 repeat protein